MSYFDELSKAMAWLSAKPNTIFLGQCVVYPGNALYKTLVDVPVDKRIEMPVAEEMQMGISLGIALTGKVVISIYPRFDFLLLAMNQLVNHLDKLEEFSHKQFGAQVIVRSGIGATKPLDPGVQHCSDYTEGFKAILKMPVVKLDSPEQIVPAYQSAYNSHKSTLIIESMDLYGME